MNRDDLIIKMYKVMPELSKRYNDGVQDEDLEMVGITAVIKCVDKSLYTDHITTEDDIYRRSYVWAENAIIDEISKKRLETVCLDDFMTISPESCIDDYFLQEDIKTELTKQEIRIFDLLVMGYNKKEICRMEQIKKSRYYEILENLKKKSGKFLW